MKILLTLAAPVVLMGSLSAQMVQLPQSMDQTLTPGAMPTQVAGFGARATTACDDFDRAALGPDWLPVGGSPAIFNNMFGSGGGNSMAQHATVSVNYDSAVVFMDLPDSPSTLTYGAAAHGLGGSDNLFTKVQSQTPGFYNTMGFYHGFNGGGIGGYGGFYALTNFTGGWVWFYTSNGGDTMNIDIDENRDGVVDYNYQSSGIIAAIPGMGTALGIGAYGSSFGSLDNFELNGGCGPVGPSVAVSAGAPGGSMTFDFAGFTPSGTIGVVYGPAGNFVAPGGPCAGLALSLLPLNATSPILVGADANGNAQVVQNVPGAGAGLSVQAADVIIGACVATNVLVL